MTVFCQDHPEILDKPVLQINCMRATVFALENNDGWSQSLQPMTRGSSECCPTAIEREGERERGRKAWGDREN